MTNFEKSINELYIFYQSRGSKRFQLLWATGVEYDIKPIRFKRNPQVRWAAAVEGVVDTVLSNRVIATRDLLMISSDKTEFPAANREKAWSLYDSLRDIATIILYHELADLLSINKALSVTLQQRGGTLIDQLMSILKTLEQYGLLKDNYGSKVGDFLKGYEYATVCQKPAYTMREVEECRFLVVC